MTKNRNKYFSTLKVAISLIIFKEIQIQNRLINTVRLYIKDDAKFLIKKYSQSQNCLECNIENHPLSSP